jgi:hypothetical protein
VSSALLGCALIDSYDFDGYHIDPVSSASDAGSAREGGLGCVAITCDDLGAECGTAPDGCGGTIRCGACVAPMTCGGGGIAKKCGCTPVTCAEVGAECGSISDGCGGTVACKSCGFALVCGGGGPNRCGLLPCVPKTCAELGAQCGRILDGCGKLLDCGPCPANKACGVKQPNHCDKSGEGHG